MYVGVFMYKCVCVYIRIYMDIILCMHVYNIYMYI